MIKFLGIAVYVISYLLFSFLYKKLDMKKLITGKIRKRVILILSLLILFVLCLSITDSFNSTKEFHLLFLGLFIAPTIALIPFLIEVNNKTKL